MSREGDGLCVCDLAWTSGVTRSSSRITGRCYATPDSGVPAATARCMYTTPAPCCWPLSAASVGLRMRSSRVPGSYFVRVEAYDDGGTLAYADSSPIKGP